MSRTSPARNFAIRALVAFALLFAASFASAQIYIDLHDFNGSDGESPSYPQVLAQGQDGNFYGTMPDALGSSGLVFKITPAGVVTVMYSFSGMPDGSVPNAGLTLGLDGNFYGSTVNGGTNNIGTIFRFTPTGKVTILYSFKGGTDGAYPYGTPILGNDGNFYGLTQAATAYKFTPSGMFTPLGTIPDRSFSPLFLGADGNFYGTTQHGGTFNLGTVFRMTPAGGVTPIYNFDTAHGAVPWGAVVQAADNNFYGTTTTGGSGGGGVVFKLTPAGIITVLHNFPLGTTDDGSDPITSLVAATDGTFYGTTSVGGANGDGVIFKLRPSGQYTFINQFDKITGGNPMSNLVQHTNGSIYGLAQGGLRGDGVFYSLDLHLGAKVRTVLSSGRVGSTVEILGSGFTTTTAVQFNGLSASFTVVSDTYMTAKVPAGAFYSPITVTTATGTAASMTFFRVLPSVISFNPTSGSVGTPVVITGNTFTGATKVTFGGIKATNFTVDSDSQITATVPTGALTGKISVTTSNGTGTSAATFTVT